MSNATNDPPRRPRRTPHDRRRRDAFMMDFENDVLRRWDERRRLPRGPRRFEDLQWAALIMSEVFPNHSDVDWHEYISVMVVVVVVVEDVCVSDGVGVCDGAVFSGSGMVVSCVSSDWQM